MKETSGCISMKNKVLSLLLFPLLLTSCGRNNASFESFKNAVDNLPDNDKFPTYHVEASIDLHDMVIEYDEEFDQAPAMDTYVPNARYNEGFKIAKDGNNPVIYTMSSRSFFLRAPLKIDSSNFYVQNENGGENNSCANAIFKRIITYFAVTNEGRFNPPDTVMYYELLSNGGFAVGGDKVRTQFAVDNYPYYYNPAKHAELEPWDEENPTPLFSTDSTYLDGRWNIRFEYNAEGWLVKESAETIGYKASVSTPEQVALYSTYTYEF